MAKDKGKGRDKPAFCDACQEFEDFPKRATRKGTKHCGKCVCCRKLKAVK